MWKSKPIATGAWSLFAVRLTPISIFSTVRHLTTTAPHELAIDEGEAEIGFYDDGGIELAEVMREYVLLSLPMQQVCNEACKGICPQCGLTGIPAIASARPKLVDERWTASAEFEGRNAKTVEGRNDA